MPRICFRLYPKSDPSSGPVDLVTLDKELCEHFHRPCLPTCYLSNWYMLIGPMLTSGLSWDEIKRSLRPMPPVLRIAKYLEENYTSSS
jgi:hypothetical protein